jgi:hypothetical protein
MDIRGKSNKVRTNMQKEEMAAHNLDVWYKGKVHKNMQNHQE